MKIVVLSCHTHSLFWFRMDMMKQLIAQGHQVTAIGQEPETGWAEKFQKNGIEYRQIQIERNGINPLHDLSALRDVKRKLKAIMPQKIFCYQAKTVIYGCLAAHSLGITEIYPLIAGLGSVFRGKGVKKSLIKLIMKMGYRQALQYSRKVMFQNKDDLSCFVDQGIIEREKTEIIHGSGVDIDKFQVTELPEKPSFLLIARLIRDKGVMEYLNACKLIKQRHPGITCMLVGPYDTNPSAITPAELKPFLLDATIEYFGEQNDVRAYLNRSSVFVLPSYHEGTPKTVLEAMASGRAVITTDAPGCRETVRDGYNGFLVPVGNVEALVKRMEQFIETPSLAERMGRQGRKIAEEKYDVNKVNKAIFEIMEV